MSLIFLKFFHYLAIIFAGGVLVGGGLIQSIFTRSNQVPDKTVGKVLKILGYLGLASLIILWITGILLSNLIYGGFAINTAFTIKIIGAAILLILSFIVNIHVYNSSKNNEPPNKSIMKFATMSGRGLIIVVLLGAAIAFN
ncbi:hypothetical protein IDH28_03515 [Pelagibacterales bacterium SAG-MED31]|nr:hypothetical protein [Pelagibacterales bacterium SAG-MED31]